MMMQECFEVQNTTPQTRNDDKLCKEGLTSSPASETAMAPARYSDLLLNHALFISALGISPVFTSAPYRWINSIGNIFIVSCFELYL